MPISRKTQEYRELLDRTMLVSAYRQQIQTLRIGLLTRADMSDESLLQAVDLLDEAGLHLTAHIERQLPPSA
jgi:hypothetical protein